MQIKELFNIEGRVAVVTGGDGSMYGSCIAEGLCEAGAKVIIASRNLARCEKAASKYREKGYEAFAYSLDLSSYESIASFTEKVWKDFIQIDILVNSAVLRPMKNYEDDLSNWEESLQVNATGLFSITRLFVGKMVPNKKGNIINISSISGIVGPDPVLYNGTNVEPRPDYFFHKAGMINLARYFASRFGKYNIRVNVISPGALLCNKKQPIGIFAKRYIQRTFLGRLASRDDIKGVIVFLASDASAYITGENIVMDGGYSKH